MNKKIPWIKRTKEEREAHNIWSRQWFQFIKDNPDKKWDWNMISNNPNITWDIVKDNMDKPSDAIYRLNGSAN